MESMNKLEFSQRLRNVVEQIEQLPDNVWKDFFEIWSFHTCKKNESLTNPGEVEKFIYFVCSGAQRVYYMTENQKEATLVFSYPDSFGGVLDSFLLQKPSTYYFETISDSTFLRVNFELLFQVAERHPAINQFIQTAVYFALSGLLERLADVQCLSSKEKYLNLLKRSPHILNHVPHKYIANYIGMDPTNFSKLYNSTPF